MAKISWTPKDIIENKRKLTAKTHFHVLRRLSRNQLRKLNELKSIDTNSKIEIKKSITHHTLQLAAINMWFISIKDFTIKIATAATIATWILAPHQIATRLLGIKNIPVQYHALALLLSLPLSMLIVNRSLISKAESISSELDEKARPFFTNTLLMGTIYSTILAGILLPPLPVSSHLASMVTYSLLGSLSFATSVFLLSLPLAYCLTLLRRTARAIRPEATVIDRLLSLLVLLEKHPDRGLDSREKKEILKRIDDTADAISQLFKEHARVSSKDTATWSRNRGEEFAGSVRALAKWIITPDRNTRENIKNKISSNFLCAARGDWDNFSRIQISSQPHKLLSAGNIISTLRTLLSSATPIAILFALNKINIIPEQTSNYFAAGAYLWSAITLLAHLDPNYSSKLSALKEAAQALSIGKNTNRS
ncbi:hypothetical protein [Corallococcus exiguus]|uniref:hypothetical protein n=1 Tax=Corallococcus exiguus TaxID=83462 RepID=UPI0014947AE4|nr:hypothetical protein [Corallococcus exiguus]NPD22028.1 hypothetical protein [Corallococcus exiguus]